MAVGDLKITADNHQHPFAPDLRMQRDTINDRDSITPSIRWEGMWVYVKEEGKHYALIGGLTNNDWVEINFVVAGTVDGNFVQYDISNQGLTSAERLNARTNIQALSKDTDDTRSGSLTQSNGGIILYSGAINIYTEEDGSASANSFRTLNTVGGGMSIQRRGSVTIRAKGDSTTDYHILRLQDYVGPVEGPANTVFEVREGGVTKGGNAVNDDDFVTLGQLGDLGGDGTFISNSDTPAGYTGANNSGVRVNAVADGLEFFNPTLITGGSQVVSSGGTTDTVSLSDNYNRITITGTGGSIGGVTGLDRKEIVVVNESSGNVTLIHEHTSASSDNRFSLPGSVDLVIPSNSYTKLLHINGRYRKST